MRKLIPVILVVAWSAFLAVALANEGLLEEPNGRMPGLDEERGAEEIDASTDVAPTTPAPSDGQSAEKSPPAPFFLLGGETPPGTLRRLTWYAAETFSGLSEAAPVLVAHGAQPGPVLCITAAVHGDELNGIEIVRDLLHGIDPANLHGTVIGVPIVNVPGFRQSSRYLPDRRDLNRYFPGNPDGSSAARIAHSFFTNIIRHCNWLVDLHTASFHRANLPQLRADLDNEAVAHLTRGFGDTVVLAGKGPEGALRRAATDAGIAAVTVEAGEPLRFQPEQVAHGVKALRSLLNHLDMVPRFRFWRAPQPTYYRSQWIRAESGGILSSRVVLGQNVRQGEVLGSVTDPISNMRSYIHSPADGRVLGMALNQTMMPGYAAYHIGIETTPDELREDPAGATTPPDSSLTQDSPLPREHETESDTGE